MDLMFDSNLLITFVTVAKARSFTEAGRRRGLQQSTASQHVRRLETKPLEIVTDIFSHRRLVVAVLDADVAEAVDMRADMALAEVGVFHIAQLVVAVFCARHRGEAAQDRLAEAGAEERYAVYDGVGQRGDDAVWISAAAALVTAGVTRLMAPV